jgi:predicted patatin/cPLA2 family phospholipase
MRDRHLAYNATLDFIEEQVKLGNTFVIRPKTKSDVGRIEKDRQKLEALYKNKPAERLGKIWAKQCDNWRK